MTAPSLPDQIAGEIDTLATATAAGMGSPPAPISYRDLYRRAVAEVAATLAGAVPLTNAQRLAETNAERNPGPEADALVAASRLSLDAMNARHAVAVRERSAYREAAMREPKGPAEIAQDKNACREYEARGRAIQRKQRAACLAALAGLEQANAEAHDWQQDAARIAGLGQPYRTDVCTPLSTYARPLARAGDGLSTLADFLTDSS